MTDTLTESEVPADKRQPVLIEKLSGYIGIYLITAFVTMLLSLFITEVATYPLSLYFSQDVICETHDASYKPGQTLIVYEFYRQTASGNEYIKTLPSLAITGFFYFAFVLIFINAMSVLSRFKASKDQQDGNWVTRKSKALINALKDFLLNLPSTITALLIVVWFYREEVEEAGAFIRYIQTFMNGLIR